jgi:DNA-binding PadR family transcriptional regulator
VEEGVLNRSEDNKYSLTEKGREEVDHPFPWISPPSPAPRSIDDVLEQLSAYVSYLEDMSKSRASINKESAVKMLEISKRLRRLGGE